MKRARREHTLRQAFPDENASGVRERDGLPTPRKTYPESGNPLDHEKHERHENVCASIGGNGALEAVSHAGIVGEAFRVVRGRAAYFDRKANMNLAGFERITDFEWRLAPAGAMRWCTARRRPMAATRMSA